jgi:uncharacterized membrane protein
MLRITRKHYVTFGGPWLLGLMVALLASESVLSQSAPLRGYVRAVSGLVPSVGRSGSFSEFPEVTTLYYAVLWPFVPAFAYRIAVSLRANDGLVIKRDSLLFRRPVTIKIILALLGLNALLITLSAYAVIFDDGRDVFSTVFNTSRIFLGAFGILFPFFVAFSLAFLVVSFQLMFFSKRGHSPLTRG